MFSGGIDGLFCLRNSLLRFKNSLFSLEQKKASQPGNCLMFAFHGLIFLSVAVIINSDSQKEIKCLFTPKINQISLFDNVSKGDVTIYLSSISIIFFFIDIQQASQPKVSDLDVVGRFDQDISGCQIPVDEPTLL